MNLENLSLILFIDHPFNLRH
jgi:ribonuclease HI